MKQWEITCFKDITNEFGERPKLKSSSKLNLTKSFKLIAIFIFANEDESNMFCLLQSCESQTKECKDKMYKL